MPRDLPTGAVKMQRLFSPRIMHYCQHGQTRLLALPTITIPTERRRVQVSNMNPPVPPHKQLFVAMSYQVRHAFHRPPLTNYPSQSLIHQVNHSNLES